MVKNEGKKKKGPVTRFLKIVASVVIPALLIFLILVGWNVYRIFDKMNDNPSSQSKGNESTNFLEDLFKEKSERITVAGFGVDKEGLRTDVIVVGTFESKTGKIDLFSVPRDTHITLSDEMYNKLSQKKWVPREMKINELHAYAGDDWAEYVIPVLEDMLGIDIHHNVKINLDAFKQLVDAIDGVDFYVPFDMYYEDPYQNLYINLKEGQQTLDGNKAEGLIRYRYGYSNGDLGRISMQQDFMKAFMNQLLSFSNITRITDLINVMYDNLETDVSLGETINYATRYYKKLNTDNMSTHTIPGTAQYLNGRSYYLVDKMEVVSFVNNTINGIGEEDKALLKDKNIEVLNGGDENGLATVISDRLKNKGYEISSVGTYEGTRVDETRIIVEDEAIGKLLLEEFDNGKLIADKSQLPEGVDVQIILGKKEKK